MAKIEKLSAEGRMQAAGIAAYQARSEAKTGVYAFERPQPAELPAAELRAFKHHKAAWAFFQSSAPSYQRVITHWVVSAKQAATRARRLEQLIQACAEHRRLR